MNFLHGVKIFAVPILKEISDVRELFKNILYYD